MTKHQVDRRTFLTLGAKAGATVCGLCMCSGFPLVRASQNVAETELLNLDKLTFCGYRCPPDCKFRQGTIHDDVELKRQAWELWKIEERFGVVFDPDQAICHGCKDLEKSEGIVLARCDVRRCVQEKELECCIECLDLVTCDKDLWRRFPHFKEKVVKMQEQYLEQT
jgi:hypothetical protein